MPTLRVNVVIIQDDQILLTHRNDFPIWCLPGGGVDDGESLATAAIREVLEETGLEVELTRLVGTYSRPRWWDGGDHCIVFTARSIGGELGRTDGEVNAVQYFLSHTLPENLLWWHRQCIHDALFQTQAVSWSQDAIWNLDGISRKEATRLYTQGKLSMQFFVDLFCKQPAPVPEKLEVGG